MSSKLTELRIERMLKAMNFLLMKMMIWSFLQSLSPVALLLDLGRKSFPISALTLRKLLF
jgi:hypothetical protein